jgi:hypothetical protein
MLACISHQLCAADADMLAVIVCTPYDRFDVVSTTPASLFGTCTQSQRHLDALATKAGEKCRLVVPVLFRGKLSASGVNQNRGK